MENIKQEVEPKLPDKESKEILEEIAKEKSEASEDVKPKESEEVKPEEVKPEPDQKDDGKVDDTIEKDKPKRTPKSMPLFEHEIAKKNWEKDLTEKENKILELTTQLQDKSKIDQTADIEKFAEDSGLPKETIKGLVDIISKSLPKQGTELSEEIKQKLQDFEESKKKLEEREEKEGFESDYKNKILPILEKDGISDDKKKERIKKIVETLAYTKKYAGYDLDHIYLVAPEFKDFKEKGKPSGEHSRGTPHIEGEEKGVMDMTDEEFDKWSEAEGKKQKTGTLTRIEGGESRSVR